MGWVSSVLNGVLLPFEYLGRAVFWLLGIFLKRAWEWIRGRREAAGTHGNAGFATIPELRLDGHLKDGSFLLGVQDGERVFALRESCVHFFGKRGEGKSQTVGANLSYYTERPKKPDIVINDSSAEHYLRLGPKMRAAGYELKVLCLDEPSTLINAGGLASELVNYHALGFLEGSTARSQGMDVESIASLLVDEMDEHSGSKHFIDAAHGVVSALIDWEYASKGGKATIAEPVRLLTTADEAERDKVLDKISLTGSDTAKAGVNIYLRVSRKERGSFNSTIGRKLRPFNDASLKDVLTHEGNAMKWEEVFNNPKPVAVFVIGGEGSAEISGPFNRLVMGQCINAVKRYYTKHRKPLHKGLRMFIDEADTLGYCKPLQDAVTRGRKYDVDLFMIWQSLGQIVTNYRGPKASESFLDGADWMITGGAKAGSLYGMVEELLGDFTALSKSESTAQFGKSESRSETARSLMKIDELKSMPRGTAVVLADRRNVRLQLPYRIEKGQPVYL